jgi:hypothetical protein
MIRINRTTAALFLYSMALVPFISLFWDTELGPLKVNWIIYPILLIIVASAIAFKSSLPKEFGYALLLFPFYLVLLLVRDGAVQDLIRVFVSLLPFFFLNIISNYQDGRIRRTAVWIYIISLLPTLIFAALQFFDVIPYNEYDTTGGERVGRMSGGYSKPNNFVAVLFPLFMLSFYLFFVARKKVMAGVLMLLILFVVYKTGLRIAVAIYFIVFLSSFFPRVLIATLLTYYKYFINFAIGVFAFIGVYIVHHEVGLVEALRGRFQMWEAHSVEFFGSNVFEILVGKGDVLLKQQWDRKIVRYIGEVHNNSFRVIIFGGFIGYLIYSYFIRYYALKILRDSEPARKFIAAACFVFFILFGITTEPLFYPAVFWSIFFWVFVWHEKK